MPGSRRSPLQVLRDLGKPSKERREAKDQRERERREHEAERLAGRTEAESRRHGSGYGGYSGR